MSQLARPPRSWRAAVGRTGKTFLPRPLRSRLRRVLDSPGLRRRIRPARWGNLRRLRPFSARYGFDRGTPVDRYYLDSFFRDQGAIIRGHVLEVRDPGFSRRFGRDITALDIVDIDPANDAASIVVDLVDQESLPAVTFDCVVAPQTLQLVNDIDAAVANIWQSLKPGGSLLVTIHALGKRYHHVPELDRWRMMPYGLADVLRRACPGAEVDVVGLGNLLAAVAFLEGVASEELTPAELDAHDPEFPVLACGRARKSAE